MSKDINEAINQALMQDVDLPAEEYKKKCEQADATAKVNGVEGKAPVSEAVRHKRIQLNFYGTILNFMASLLCEVSETNRLLRELTKTEGDNDRK